MADPIPGTDTSTPAVVIRELVRHFGAVQALRGLSLSIERGSVFGLVGNNGAGKTTAIHTLMGLLPPTGGEVSVLGLDPGRAGQDIRRRVGFFPERDEPYAWLRLRSLLQMGALAYPDWDASCAAEWCERFNLDTRKRFKQMSKGMAAKSKLVAALSHRPELLILDEPTSGLDPGSRQDLIEAIQSLHREGVTILFSSHNLDDVERVATHVGLIDQGRCVLHTACEQITERFGRVRVTPNAAIDLSLLDERAEARLEVDGDVHYLVSDRRADWLAALVARFGGTAVVEPADLPAVFRLITAGDRPAPGAVA